MYLEKLGEINIKKLKNIIIKILFSISLIILIILLLEKIQIRTKIMEKIYPVKYQETVKKYSKEYNVEENLIYAIIKAESNFNKNAKSNKGAKGLMQLMNKTAIDVAKKIDKNIDEKEIEKNLFNIDTNIKLGTKYISILIDKYNNIPLALAAYNAGIGNVDKWIENEIIKKDGNDIENIPYKETNNYVRKILRDYKIYEQIYNKH